MNEEREFVEFINDEGEPQVLELIHTLFYNGEEYAVLTDVEEEDEDHVHGEDCEHELGLYVTKLNHVVDEDGEEIDEFIPVEDPELMEALVEIVQAHFDAEYGEDDGTEA